MINTPVFAVHLNDSVEAGTCTCGIFDGLGWSLIAATSGGRLLMHSPHIPQSTQQSYLNVNKKVTALSAANLEPHSDTTTLLIGSSSSFQAYHVHTNSDLFYISVPGGVHSILPTTSAVDCGWPTLLAGGQGTVAGYSAAGEVQLRLTIGDTATALALVDIDGDGRLQLVVGSSEGYLRVYRGTTLMEEVGSVHQRPLQQETQVEHPQIKEADCVVALAPLGGAAFGYGLANGTTGVYQGLKRRWRLKSKHPLVAMVAFDLDGDGATELLTGWANGKVECRRSSAGEVVMRDCMTAPVAALALVPGEEGRAVAVAVDGEVRGYAPRQLPAHTTEAAACVAQLEELMKAKQELLYELHAYEYCNTIAFGEAAASGMVIPASTSLEFIMEVKPGSNHISLVLLTTSSALIRGAVVFAEKLFEGESSFVLPRQPSTKIQVPLTPQEDTPIHMLAKVQELDVKLPKYSMYALLPQGQQVLPASCVTFGIKDRAARLAGWVQSNFIVTDPQLLLRADSDVLDCCFHCLRDGTVLAIQMNTANKGEVHLRTDNLALAASLVQDIAAHFSLGDCNPLAEVPHVGLKVAQHLATIENCLAMQQHLLAESADSAASIKTLVVKAEDACQLRDMAGIKAAYAALHKVNGGLLQGHSSREALHAQLLAAHKGLNTIIHDAAELRVGGAKAKTLAACHEAVQQGGAQAAQQLVTIIRQGVGT